MYYIMAYTNSHVVSECSVRYIFCRISQFILLLDSYNTKMLIKVKYIKYIDVTASGQKVELYMPTLLVGFLWSLCCITCSWFYELLYFFHLRILPGCCISFDINDLSSLASLVHPGTCIKKEHPIVCIDFANDHTNEMIKRIETIKYQSLPQSVKINY